MKALVTGATGFAGRWLLRELREAGWRVITLGRRGPADVVGDLRRMKLRRLPRVDVAFHLAAFSNPAGSVGADREAYESNAVATGRVIREIRAERFVVASSCQVYGAVPAADNPVRELRRPSPRTPYAASKLCAEALALAGGRDVVVLRPFNHTGPGQSATYVCPYVARQVAQAERGRGKRVVEVSDLAPRRDFFDVRDMARAYVMAAERGRAGAVYNVASGRAVAIREILRLIVDRARVPLRIRGRKGAPTLLSGDATAFRRDTGWKARIPLSRTLAEVLDFERRAVE